MNGKELNLAAGKFRHCTLGLAFTAAALCSSPVLSDAVSLQFVGQHNEVATVDAYFDRITVRDGKEHVELTMLGSYQSRTTKHSEGFLIRQDQHAFKMDNASDSAVSELDPIFEALQSMQTDKLISEVGELVRLENLDDAIESTRARLVPMIEAVPSHLESSFTLMLEQALSKEILTRRAQEEWTFAVGLWNNANMEKGYLYPGEYVEATNEFGGITLGFNAAYEYLGEVACNDTDEAQSCVEVHFESSMQPDYSKPLTKAIVERLRLPATEEVLVAKDINVRLITEAETLRPHQLIKIERIQKLDDDYAGWVEQVNRSRFIYRYQ